jgi:maltokinase
VKIDTQGLLETIPDRRWFGAKSRSLAGLEVLDRCIVDEGPPALVIALAELRFEDGGIDLYQLPLVVDEAGSRDAFEDGRALVVFGRLLAHGVTCPGDRGSFRFGGAGLDPSSPPGVSFARVLKAEQSNSSMVLDDDVIVKFFRRVEAGPNPELELNRVLTSEGFENVPAQVGELSYEGPLREGGPEVQLDLAIAQRFVTDGVDGWEETLRQVRDFYAWARDHVQQAAPRQVRRLTEDRCESWLNMVGELGDVTARMHVTLARKNLEADFAPESLAVGDLKQWADAIMVSLASLIEAGVEGLDELRPAIEECVDRLREVDDAGLVTRIHGDYHLGQTMITPRGWLLLDFEGEPVRPLAQRRAKQSPLRDVAGMLRSFSYAAFSGLFEEGEPDGEAWRLLRPWARGWEAVTRERFLHSYMRTSHEGGFLPPRREDVTAILDVLEIDKALYELDYEQGHRPGWMRIPLQGISDVTSRSGSR